MSSTRDSARPHRPRGTQRIVREGSSASSTRNPAHRPRDTRRRVVGSRRPDFEGLRNAQDGYEGLVTGALPCSMSWFWLRTLDESASAALDESVSARSDRRRAGASRALVFG